MCVRAEKDHVNVWSFSLAQQFGTRQEKEDLHLFRSLPNFSESATKNATRPSNRGARATSNHTKHNNESNKAHSQLAATETNTENKPLRTC